MKNYIAAFVFLQYEDSPATEKVARQIEKSCKNSCMRSRSGRVRQHCGPEAGVCTKWSRVFGSTSANIGTLPENDNREGAENWRIQFAAYLASQRGREDSTGVSGDVCQLRVRGSWASAGHSELQMLAIF